MEVAEEFALKIRQYGSAMSFEPAVQPTSNWAKYPLLLVSGEDLQLQAVPTTHTGESSSNLRLRVAVF